MFTQLRAIIAGLCLLAVLIIAGLIYWRGSSNATTKADLRVAREVITRERETLKITSAIDLRVNAEALQTAQSAEAATREIDQIRLERKPTAASASAPTLAVGAPASAGAPADPGDARIVQLAQEARAAARASSARLQPAGTGAR